MSVIEHKIKRDDGKLYHVNERDLVKKIVDRLYVTMLFENADHDMLEKDVANAFHKCANNSSVFVRNIAFFEALRSIDCESSDDPDVWCAYTVKCFPSLLRKDRFVSFMGAEIYRDHDSSSATDLMITFDDISHGTVYVKSTYQTLFDNTDLYLDEAQYMLGSPSAICSSDNVIAGHGPVEAADTLIKSVNAAVNEDERVGLIDELKLLKPVVEGSACIIDESINVSDIMKPI